MATGSESNADIHEARNWKIHLNLHSGCHHIPISILTVILKYEMYKVQDNLLVIVRLRGRMTTWRFFILHKHPKMIFTVIFKHEHAGQLFNLHRGECKQQQRDGDDNVIAIFTSKVQHLWNTVHQLWVCVSTERQCYKRSVHLSPPRCCPRFCRLKTTAWFNISVKMFAQWLLLSGYYPMGPFHFKIAVVAP